MVQRHDHPDVERVKAPSALPRDATKRRIRALVRSSHILTHARTPPIPKSGGKDFSTRRPVGIMVFLAAPAWEQKLFNDIFFWN